VSRFQYPANIRIVRVPCTSRINPLYVLKSLEAGADGVLIAGCYPGECNYQTGNLYARRKFVLLKRFLEFLGIEKNRVQFFWLSSSEGERFARMAGQAIENVRTLGPATRLVWNSLRVR
jgi:coenzyme F420-reducing hydrogenase delta subunit